MGAKGASTGETTTDEAAVEEHLSLLLAKPTKELKAMHRKLCGAEYRGKDKGKVATKIAKHLAALGAAPGSTVKGVDTGGATLNGLSLEEAKAKLGEIKATYDRIAKLKSDRRQKTAKQSERIAELTEQIETTLKDEEEPADKRLAVIDVAYNDRKKLEAARDQVRKSYGDRIKSAQKGLKGLLDNIRQANLPFPDEAIDAAAGGDDDDEE